MQKEKDISPGEKVVDLSHLCIGHIEQSSALKEFHICYSCYQSIFSKGRSKFSMHMIQVSEFESHGYNKAHVIFEQ